ncbi:MAG: DNA mismatch repair endonuclease MutL [Deltaproteobacteria bacterium]|nr:DNA mismatch repair endonuclease MutL [Deltaproteobacteria bacterium]MBW2140136.1 DNA mismatch repair endonuclease MutL [Deltaproteobacteria bacterium]
MASIRLLSEQLINRIAAGEVVERPASVLKELLENSLDAGATRIEIEAQAGGRRLIMVSDDGLGMPPDDMLLAVERHATSKLSEDTDLLRIDTLGFRGEALPSIGAVSRMTLTSASDSKGLGRRVRLSGGKMLAVEEASRGQGTTVEVRDLFFNVPARRKFLKSAQTEAAHLAEMAQRYALGRPELRLIYKHNSQQVIATSPSEKPLARVARVLGRETAKKMFPFEGSYAGVSLSGFLGRPEIDRSRARAIYIYVNGRPVMDRLLTRAVMEAYRGRLMTGRYPVAIIFLTVDPEVVDINVHPAKAEVRFRQPGQVMQVSVNIMSQALNKEHRPLVSPIKSPPPPVPYPAINSAFFKSSVAEPLAWNEEADRKTWRPEVHAPHPPAARPDDVFETERHGLRAIGALFRTYILAQGPDGLYIIDQHAAHERILFERLQTEMAAGPLNSQQLLIPVTFEVTPTQAVGLEGLLAELSRFGFDLEPFGGQTFVLRAIPAVLTGRDPHKVMGEIIDEVDTLRPDAGLARIEEAFMQTLCCHGSIRAGHEMTLEEMDQLLTDLSQAKISTHCPHGRPLIYHIDLKELEKKFRRI